MVQFGIYPNCMEAKFIVVTSAMKGKLGGERVLLWPKWLLHQYMMDMIPMLI